MTANPPTDEGKKVAQSGKPASGRLAGALRWLRSLAKGVVAVAALAAAFWLGSQFGATRPAATPDRGFESETRTSMSEAPSGDVDYWTCSMHPQIRQPQPGLCPICGMDLVPVRRATAEAPRPKKTRYACAMMCVPPMAKPGLCPVCGMDMVPVEEHGAEEGADAGRALSEITLSPTARKLAELQVAPVERRFVSAEVRMVGKVEYDETRQRTISSRVPGRLDRLYVDYTGVPVKKGEHLVHLYSPELLAAQEELIQSLKAFAELGPSALPDIVRIRRESLEAARQKLLLWGLTEEQVRETEQRKTPSDHLTIYAPIGGIVTDKRLVEGAYVEEGTEIYTIADLSHVWVKLDAYEMDLVWLRYGQDVEFTTEAYPGDVFHGTIAFIDPVLNAKTRTAKVRVNVPNDDGRLKPEMFVRAVVRSELTAEGQVLHPVLAGKWICTMHPEVVADGPGACTQCGMPLVPAESLGYASQSPSESQPPLVIPMTAPLITGKRAIVYVEQPDRPGRYEAREVLLGPRAKDSYIVREGLAEGEFVVSRGNLYLDSAAQILGKRSMMQPDIGESSPGHAHGDNGPPESQPPPPAPGAGDPAAHPGQPRRAPLPDEARMALDAIFDSYFALQRALSHDQFDPAKSAAAELVQAIGRFDALSLPEAVRAEWSAVRDGLQKSAEAIASSKSIEPARAAFEGASNALITLGRQVGIGKRERAVVYHCPMAFDNRGARWLQPKEGVENPYFGAVMFKCGVLKESLTGGPDGDQGGGKHD